MTLFCVLQFQLGRPGEGSYAQGILGRPGRELTRRPARLHACFGAAERS